MTLLTHEEAIHRLRKRICNEKPVQHICRDACMYGSNYCEIDMAIDALKKQIPDKVIRHPTAGKDEMYALCPKCSRDVVGSGFYCWNCGQRLDWSETV